MAKLTKKIYRNPAPINVDAVIDSVQTLLSDKVDWLEASYGRAWKEYKTINDKKLTRPMTYQGKAEYFDCLPNDTFQAFSFWFVNDRIQPRDYLPNVKVNYTYNVDLICWFNNKKTYNVDYPMIENHIQDFKKVLRYVSSIEIKSIYTSVEEVYRGFSISAIDEKAFTYPFGGFRINMDITVLEIDEFGGC